MPELPEVETISRGLRSILPGQKIVGVEVHEFRLRSRVDGDFCSQLLGKTILDVGRRGKYLLLFLEGEGVWVLIFDVGPGYRVYYGLVDDQVVLLLSGGGKKKQGRDIQDAISYWEDFKAHEGSG